MQGISYQYWKPLLSEEINVPTQNIVNKQYQLEPIQKEYSQNVDRATNNRKAADFTKQNHVNYASRIQNNPGSFHPESSQNSHLPIRTNQDTDRLPSRKIRGNSRRRKHQSNSNRNFRNGRGRNRRKKINNSFQNVGSGFISDTNYQRQYVRRPIIQDVNNHPSAIIRNPVPHFSHSTLGRNQQNSYNNDSMFMLPTWKLWQFTPCSKSCGGGECN